MGINTFRLQDQAAFLDGQTVQLSEEVLKKYLTIPGLDLLVGNYYTLSLTMDSSGTKQAVCFFIVVDKDLENGIIGICLDHFLSI